MVGTTLHPFYFLGPICNDVVRNRSLRFSQFSELPVSGHRALPMCPLSFNMSSARSPDITNRAGSCHVSSPPSCWSELGPEQPLWPHCLCYGRWNCHQASKEVIRGSVKDQGYHSQCLEVQLSPLHYRASASACGQHQESGSTSSMARPRPKRDASWIRI